MQPLPLVRTATRSFVMADVAPTVVYLLTRIEVLQREISQHYHEVAECTREIQLTNNLLMQLRPVPRADTRISDEARYPNHPAVRPLAPRQPTAESIKGRYPDFPEGRPPQPILKQPTAPQQPATISHPLRGRKSIGEILRRSSHGRN